MRCFPGLVLPICLLACGGTTATQPSHDSGVHKDAAAGDSGSKTDAGARAEAGSPGTLGAVCSMDGMPARACDQGLSCPTPAHGHNTTCCADVQAACRTDVDCCTGVCLLASGTCSKGIAPGSACTKGSDCVTGVCGPTGVCAGLAAGATCVANAECDIGLCTNGVCVCWAAGTAFPADASVENCCSQSEGLLPGGGQGCG